MLRKPPRPTYKHKDRPVSGPPAFRGARLEEMPGGSAIYARTHSEDETPDHSHTNKENRPVDTRDAGEGSNGSDSGLDSSVSIT